MGNLKDKNIIIVGASSGLGKALAEIIADKGTNLYLLSRTAISLSLQSKAEFIPCDVKDTESIKKAFNKIDELTEKIDVVIDCAGIGLVKNLENSTSEEIRNVIETNLIGAISVCQEAYKRMLKNEEGHIVVISSTSGIRARANETVYCASKWGLRGFTESLRLEASIHKIRVTGIYPGGMRTNFWKDRSPEQIADFMDPSDIAGQIVNIISAPAGISPSEYIIERG